jgi:hypothetical protein
VASRNNVKLPVSLCWQELGVGGSGSGSGSNPTLHSLSSNFRELATLALSLERQRVSNPIHIQGHRLVYSTDNDVTYNIARRGNSTLVELHRKVPVIKSLKLARGCHLEVIHVPGTSMIDQRTYGLSRGIWLTHSSQISTNITMDLFHPAPPSTLLLDWIGM